MRILEILIYPVAQLAWGFSFFKDIATSIVNRVLTEGYIFYHSLQQDLKHREIENLSQAIQKLERAENAESNLAPLIDANVHFVTEDVTREMLIATLKTHRYSFSHLYRGTQKNEELGNHIRNYILPATSPLRRTPTSSYKPSITPTKLTFALELDQLSEETITALAKDPSAFGPTVVWIKLFHTFRCQPALQQAVQDLKKNETKWNAFLEKLAEHVQHNSIPDEHLSLFCERHCIDFSTLQNKSWEEFVTLCLP